MKPSATWHPTEIRRVVRPLATGAEFVLKAMDHTHCFTWGHDLTAKVAHIDVQQDRGIYGVFPEFQPFLKREVLQDAIKRLAAIGESEVRKIVESIPRPWDVSAAARRALGDFILGRARFLTDTMEKELWPQMVFNFPE